jgi:hypothetical protein
MLPHASHRRLRNDLAAKRHPPFRLPFFVVTAFSIRPDVELDAPPIWKSAAQQVRKTALRAGGFHYMNVLEDPPKGCARIRTDDSVGGTPTDAVETAALPKKSLMIGAFSLSLFSFCVLHSAFCILP